MDDQARVDAAVTFLSDSGVRTPRVALILGSGMGAIAAGIESAVSIKFPDVPHFPVATVAGHAGRVVSGVLEDVPCLIFQGRLHAYEGHSMADVTFPVRLAYGLGARVLLATNAAGGIAQDLGPGALMLIAGHVSLTPPRSAGAPGPRGPGPYDDSLLRQIENAALNEAVRLRRGVYGWVPGPSYETPAEIRALRKIGADAVGMSTIPEILQGHALGMKAAAISAITNRAAGLSRRTLHHEEVLQVAARNASDLQQLLRRFLREAM